MLTPHAPRNRHVTSRRLGRDSTSEAFAASLPNSDSLLRQQATLLVLQQDQNPKIVRPAAEEGQASSTSDELAVVDSRGQSESES